MKKIALFLSAVGLIVTMSLVGINVLSVAQPVSATESDIISSEQTSTSNQTVTFNIEKMTCGTCPITVRKAMQAVEGVGNVSVNFSEKTATVVFDPTVATLEKIGSASTNAGYPATPER